MAGTQQTPASTLMILMTMLALTLRVVSPSPLPSWSSNVTLSKAVPHNQSSQAWLSMDYHLNCTDNVTAFPVYFKRNACDTTTISGCQKAEFTDEFALNCNNSRQCSRLWVLPGLLSSKPLMLVVVNSTAISVDINCRINIRGVPYTAPGRHIRSRRFIVTLTVLLVLVVLLICCFLGFCCRRDKNVDHKKQQTPRFSKEAWTAALSAYPPIYTYQPGGSAPPDHPNFNASRLSFTKAGKPQDRPPKAERQAKANAAAAERAERAASVTHPLPEPAKLLETSAASCSSRPPPSIAAFMLDTQGSTSQDAAGRTVGRTEQQQGTRGKADRGAPNVKVPKLPKAQRKAAAAAAQAARQGGAGKPAGQGAALPSAFPAEQGVRPSPTPPTVDLALGGDAGHSSGPDRHMGERDSGVTAARPPQPGGVGLNDGHPRRDARPGYAAVAALTPADEGQSPRHAASNGVDGRALEATPAVAASGPDFMPLVVEGATTADRKHDGAAARVLDGAPAQRDGPNGRTVKSEPGAKNIKVAKPSKAERQAAAAAAEAARKAGRAS